MLALPHRVRKLGKGPAGLEPHAGARNRKKTPPQISFNHFRSSIKPGGAPDPFI